MTLPPGFKIISYSPNLGPMLTIMWRKSFETATGIKDPNPLAAQVHYLNEKIVPNFEINVIVKEKEENVIGFIASSAQEISQLYIHVNYQRLGMGTVLVELAKRHSSGTLSVYTYKSNIDAQAFYESQNFKLISSGFDKQWGKEDLFFQWSRD